MTSTTLTFQADDSSMRPGHLYTRDSDTIASLSFMDDGTVFVYYTAGDCDTALPYVELAPADVPAHQMTDEELEHADLGPAATDAASIAAQQEIDRAYAAGETTAQQYADATREVNTAACFSAYGHAGPAPRTWFTARSDEVARIMAQDTAGQRTWFIASAEETSRLAAAPWPARTVRWDDEVPAQQYVNATGDSLLAAYYAGNPRDEEAERLFWSHFSTDQVRSAADLCGVDTDGLDARADLIQAVRENF